MAIVIAGLAFACVLAMVAVHGLREAYARQPRSRRLLAHAAWPLAAIGAIFVARFWTPTNGPYIADVRYPFGSAVDSWAVSFGFTWIAFGLLFGSLAVLAPSPPSRPTFVVLLFTWALCWLPHGVIGLGVALEGTTAESANRYHAWAGHPLGAAVLAVDAALLLLHFGLSLAGFALEGRATMSRPAPNGDDVLRRNRHAARILALDQAWKVAAARHDLDGMMSIYAPDAQELLAGVPAIAGRQAIRDFYRRLVNQLPQFQHQFDAEEIVVAASGDLAVVRGRYCFTADTRHPDVTEAGKFVGVWRYREGDWRLQTNISNGNGHSGP